MTDPWDRPPFPARGDDTEDITYAAVGRALSQWENFELDLAAIFSLLVSGGEESVEAARAYGSVVSFRGRSDMVSAAATAYFERHPDAEAQAKLVDLIKIAGQFSGRRNEIAHGIVFQYLRFDDGGELRSAGFCLYPPSYNTQKTKVFGYPKYIYSSVEIMDFASKFAALGDPADATYSAIHPRHEPLPRKYRGLEHVPL